MQTYFSFWAGSENDPSVVDRGFISSLGVLLSRPTLKPTKLFPFGVF